MTDDDCECRLIAAQAKLAALVQNRDHVALYIENKSEVVRVPAGDIVRVDRHARRWLRVTTTRAEYITSQKMPELCAQVGQLVVVRHFPTLAINLARLESIKRPGSGNRGEIRLSGSEPIALHVRAINALVRRVTKNQTPAKGALTHDRPNTAGPAG